MSLTAAAVYALATADAEETRAALRRDGALLDVSIYPKCAGGRECEPIRGKALIDPGADRSVLEFSEAEVVGAEPDGIYHAQGVTREAIPLPVYSDVRFDLGGDLGSVAVERAAATPHLKSQGIVALIGRDILEKSKFTYDGPSGSFTLATPGGLAEVKATPSRAPLVAAGLGIALGAALAWLIAPACAACPVSVS